MGRVKDWLIEMQEDAAEMSREEWMEKHGESAVEVYNDVHRAIQGIQGDLFEDDGPPE